VYIEIEPIKQQWQPYLENGVDPNRGIIDFRITLGAVNGEANFKKISYLLTEAIANAVLSFDRAFNYVEEPSMNKEIV